MPIEKKFKNKKNVKKHVFYNNNKNVFLHLWIKIVDTDHLKWKGILLGLEVLSAQIAYALGLCYRPMLLSPFSAHPFQSTYFEYQGIFKAGLQLHKPGNRPTDWQSSNCTLYTAHFDFTKILIPSSDIPVLEIIPNFYSNSVLRFQFQF